MEQPRGKRLPVDPNAYELFEEIGDGVSATVHRALCIPLNKIVAIKVLDLEKRNGDMDVIRKEVQTMSLINHPNVVRAYCSFTSGHTLWVVMPFMAGGSCLHIMKSTYPEGFEEPVIATLLHEVLKALVYLHSQGYIHRDIKAGNILIDANGAVKLADFGVSACLFDNWDRHRSWNTFVGTPCWMAPEVMQQLHGYDFKADVWSFGITALELAHGRAPFSKYPPMKVLLMTLQNAPPGLDYERDKRFSKSFKAMVGSCLVKDPKKRPSVEKLLKHSFFKHARSNEYLRRTILDGLVPLCERFRKLKATDAENKDRDEEHLSQQEYIKGVSAWDFNIEDLKAQAALIDDISDLSPREGMGNNKLKNILADDDDSLNALNQETCTDTNHTAAHEDVLPEFQDFEGSLASFPVHPLQALKVCFDTCEDDTSTSSTEWQDAMLSSFETHQYSSETQDLESEFQHNSERIVAKSTSPELQNCLGGPISTEDGTGHMYRNGQQTKHQPERSQNIPLISQELREANLQVPVVAHEEAREGKVIQCKGRFKVTSADIGPKGSSTSYCTSNPHSGSLTSVMPLLQFVLQQNSIQREEVTELVRLAERASGRESDIPLVCSNEDVTQSCSVSRRERELQLYAHALKQRISHLVEETQNLKMQNAQLQKQFNALSGKAAADMVPRGNDEARPK